MEVKKRPIYFERESNIGSDTQSEDKLVFCLF